MTAIPIDSLSDDRLADYRGLTDVALRSRTEPANGLYMAEGRLVIERALAAGHRPRSILAEERREQEVRELLGDRDVPVYLGSADLLRGVTGYQVHRGALAAMERPMLPPLAEILASTRHLLVLEDLVDHTNVGAAFRSAAGLGFGGVLVSPRCADPLYRRSVKVSMGAVLTVPWTRAQNWPGDLAEVRAAGLPVVALTPAGSVSLAGARGAVAGGCALVIGTEGEGLTGPAMAQADLRCRIPMSGGVDSLNAAAAAAVACYALGPAAG